MTLHLPRLFPTMALAWLMCAIGLRGQGTATLTTLHTFSAFAQTGTETTNADGAEPNAALLQGSDGNFYGTTQFGGADGDGTVFKMTSQGALTTLHSFSGTGTDGQRPYCSLIEDAEGNFYGTTFYGGTSGNGTIFKITGSGTLTTLHSFSGTGDEGSGPEARLVRDSAGDLYGTTYEGGTYGFGTVFRLTTGGTLSTLHSFNGSVVTDGSGPTGGLTMGKDGNFYGAAGGGTNQDGVIYEITPAGTLTILYDFTQVNGSNVNKDGRGVYDSLTLGTDGNFYGTTIAGGSGGDGTVFRVSPTGGFAVLYSFSALGSNGTNGAGGTIYSGLVAGADGNFYGLANRGAPSGDGAVFQITPAGAVTTLHLFGGSSPTAADADGATPRGNLIQASDGNFYGMTSSGGAGGHGTVFRLIPGSGAHPAFFTGEVALNSGVYYLSFANKNYFGYYSFLSDPSYIYHFDLGYEYVFDAADGKSGVYLYDFASQSFFYTSPTFPFPYLYDFTLKSVLYYYPNTASAGHYTSNPRYFFNFATGKIITK